MISMTMILLNEGEVMARLFSLKQETDEKLGRALVAVGARGARAVAALAPVEVGTYRGTITASPVESSGDGIYVRIGTDAPQGRRLELDYTGPDTRGRTFNHTSLPHPHFEPVSAMLAGWLVEELRS